MAEDQEPHAKDREIRTGSLDGIWRMEWSVARPDEDVFGGIPFTLMVQRRRACGIDRYGAVLTGVFGQQTEETVDVVAWVDPAIADARQQMARPDGIYVRQAQSYRGTLDVIRTGDAFRLVGSVSHSTATIIVRLEWVGPLP
jgi:hypothetical protein